MALSLPSPVIQSHLYLVFFGALKKIQECQPLDAVDLYSIFTLCEMEQKNNMPKVKRIRLNRRVPGRTWNTSTMYKDFLELPLNSPYQSLDLQYNDPNDLYYGTRFRNFFRMSWAGFRKLSGIARVALNWNDNARDCVGKLAAPLDLLILSYLSILGGATTYPHLELSTHLGSQTHRNFFKLFSSFGRQVLYPLFVKVPSTNEEFEKTMHEFTNAGFPGCVGAVDCVHVRLWGCPEEYKILSTGKEKFPTRVFQVVCDFNRRVLHSTVGYYGSYNDKTVLVRDKFMNNLKSGLVGENVEWTIFSAEGIPTVKIGELYVICDGGYLNWNVLISNVKRSDNESVQRWSNMQESLRKAIECCFGIIKQRFRIFKKGVDFPSFELLDDTWFTGLALHTMLIDVEQELVEPVVVTGSSTVAVEFPETNAYGQLRVDLINHFAFLWANGEVKWPRTGRTKLKKFSFDQDDEDFTDY